MPRGIVAVYAMARPRRTAIERETLLEAAGQRGSVRSRADRVAAQVADYLARDEASDPGDVEAVARRLAVALAPSPIELLALHPEADAAALVRAARLARFEARGCRQILPAEWERETAAIVADVRRRLAGRYARLLAA